MVSSLLHAQNDSSSINGKVNTNGDLVKSANVLLFAESDSILGKEQITL